jgi:hypothetical protein
MAAVGVRQRLAWWSVLWLAVTLGLVPVCGGCARSPRQSVSHLWDRVPGFRWSSDDPEPSSATATANVARTVDPDALPAQSDQTVLADPPFDEAEADVRPPGPPPIVEGWAAESAAGRDDFGVLADDDQRLRDLKAALTADAIRELSSEDAPTAPHPLRLRVDNLLRRAQDLLKRGRLSEARRNAQLAVDLSDSVALEFLPSEERPVDLLREIDVRMQAEHASLSQSAAPIPPDDTDLDEKADREHAEQRRTVAGERRETHLAAANIPLTNQRPSPADTAPPPAEVVVLESAYDADLVFGSVPPRQPAGGDDGSVLSPVTISWEAPGLDGPARGVPPTAPEPPRIDSIEPLPAFRDRQAIQAGSPTMGESQPQFRTSEPFYWTDVIPVVALVLVLVVFGTGLAFRSWRQHRRITGLQTSPGH